MGGPSRRSTSTTGEVETLYTEVDGGPLKGPNDLVFDRAGGFWFTDHGKTHERDRRPRRPLLRPARRLARRGGRCSRSTAPTASACRRTRTGSTWPRPTPAGCGWWRIAAPGRLDTHRSARRRGATCVAGLPGEQLLDSLAVDGEGHVCVATIRNGGITDIDPADGSTVHVPTGDPLTTNICFGGPDLRTAYITCSLGGRWSRRPGRGPGWSSTSTRTDRPVPSRLTDRAAEVPSWGRPTGEVTR